MSTASQLAVLVLTLAASISNVPRTCAQETVTQAMESTARQTAVKPDRRWCIGVKSKPAPEVVCAQLRIDGGLAVTEILAGSPAEFAGLSVHDVLVRVNGKPIRAVIDLDQAIWAAQGAVLEIELIREGEELSLQVTPRNRSRIAGMKPLIIKLNANDEIEDESVRQIKEFLEHPNSKSPAQILVVRPAIVLKPDLLPGGSSEHRAEKDLVNESDMQLRFDLPAMESQGTLLCEVDLSETKVVSGCLIELTKMIQNQIEMRKAELEQLMREHSQLDHVIAGTVNDPTASKSSNRLSHRISEVESQLKTLEETHALLQRRTGGNQQATPASGSDIPHASPKMPDQSHRERCYVGPWS
jgi:hypothetical protein